jgi:hypothetical protein
MRRWPLSTAAALLVLVAHLTVALAGEAYEPPRPILITGRVVESSSRGEPHFDLELPDRGPLRYPLVPTDSAHREVLARNLGRPTRVQVGGIMCLVKHHQIILVETIKEFP